MKNRFIILLTVIVCLYSCKTIVSKTIEKEPTNTTTNKMLVPIKLGLNNNKKDFYIEKYDINFKNVANKKQEKVYINDTLIYSITNYKKYYIFEIFNDEFLLLSEYINNAAPGTEELKRVNLFLVNLEDLLLYKFHSGGIYLVMQTNNLAYYKNSTYEDNMFSIQDFIDGDLFLINIKGETIKLEMTKVISNIIE